MKQIFLKTAMAFILLGSPIFAADTKKPQKKPQTVTLELSTKGNDISFDQTAIEMPFAPIVELRFVNKAGKDSEIQHNVAILKPDSMDEVIKKLQGLGYDVEKMRKDPNILAMTKVLEPGSQEVVEFKPPAPGFYPYICLMAGHGDMLNMRGILHVK